ncbi:MAG: leucine-rich repeat protein [Proteobacteria bacterium]|nr:leucine-rich repeat protein [Pseudomonadota bacterium]
MLKKNFLKSVALMGVSVTAGVCAQASELVGDEPQDAVVTQTGPFATMPNEVTEHILSYLSAEEAALARLVCASWRGILENQHGRKAFAHSNAFYNPYSFIDTSLIPDADVTQMLAFHIKHSHFAPLENVFIGPNNYPQGTRLLEAKDLEAHPDTVSAWYNALFGEAPQDAHTLALVMSALPQILVREETSKETLRSMTSYVKKVGKNTRFKRFTGTETEQEKDALGAWAHTMVVRSDELQAHKDELTALLATHADHHVILSIDGEDFLQDGVLTMSEEDIPRNLRHLTLADPFGKVTTIGNTFLFKAALKSFGVRGLANLRAIGDGFLSDTHITSVDTRGLPNLTKIGTGFLVQTGITSFDTRGLPNIQSIGAFFLANTSLKSVDTRGLTNLTTIDEYCFHSCKGLKSVDTTHLSNLASIGGSFLSYAGVTDFDARGLANLTSIGDRFLLRTGITSFDPTPLTAVKQVGPHFFYGTPLSPEERTKVDGFLKQVAQRNIA